MKKPMSTNLIASKTAFNAGEPAFVVVQPPSSLTSTLLMSLVGLVSLTMTYLTYRQNKRNPSPQAIIPARLDAEEHHKLHAMLDDYFNEQELREICFEMGVDYEDLPFSGQTHKARELVALCVRTDQLAKLRARIKAERPHLFPKETRRLKSNQVANNLQTGRMTEISFVSNAQA